MSEQEFSIKHWAEEDRPREKLILKGKSALSNAELIGILLGSGTRSMSAVDVGKLLLKHADNDLYQLSKMSIKDLTSVKGIGTAKAITIISALELGRRRKEAEGNQRIKINSSVDAYKAMVPYLADLRHEEFWIILLNRANEIIKPILISKGGISGTLADTRLIFKAAIDHLSCGIILSHNHPSGNLRPSQADIQLTKKMKEAGSLLDIPVVDHIIFTDKGYYSFIDKGLL
ncbi:MAG: DNA repair protein RadC [Bacteroidota bacterium]